MMAISAVGETTTERPIECEKWSVRRILARQKSQVHRLVRPQPATTQVVGPERFVPARVCEEKALSDELGEQEEAFGIYDKEGRWAIRCPYGAPGGLLWVREPYRLPHWARDVRPEEYARRWADEEGWILQYAADQHSPCASVYEEAQDWGDLRPKGQMPKAFSRLEAIVATIDLCTMGDLSARDAYRAGVRVEPEKGLEANQAYDQSEIEEKSRELKYALRKRWERRHGAGSWDPTNWMWKVGLSIVTEREDPEAFAENGRGMPDGKE